MSMLSRALSGTLVVVAFASACKDPLTVDNLNNPDRARVLARSSDVEVLIKGAFKTLFNGTFGADGLQPSARAMSWENASNLANWGLGPRSAIPRAFIDNNRGNSYLSENFADWRSISRAIRAAADGVNKMDGLTLGSAAADERAKAFGWFSLGAAMGYLSLTYDSAVAVNPHDDIALIPELSGYAATNAAALAALDSAITHATAARNVTDGYGTASMFDNTWIAGSAYTADEFIRLIRSYKAYMRANVARTPAERAAVTWTAVRDDAAAGITADIIVRTDPTLGWDASTNQWYLYQQWHQASALLAGMADTSGGYNAWLAAPVANRVAFLVVTPDLRWPQGTTRAAQIASSAYPPPAGRYFRNRATADPDAAPFSTYYDWYRMLPLYNATWVGTWPFFPKAMNDNLRAEALIRLGDIPGAAALIDLTRVPNGLPALTGVVTTASQAVPGGNACVPRVPQAPAYTSSGCGTIMEAMKWEYRMESYFLAYLSHWFSGRGWGDLPDGTAVHWPVPYQEMDTRRASFYPLGGVGRAGGAVGRGTYGF